MSKNSDNVFFPVLINLQRFPCLVVGGGDVAGRKVVSLLDFNADVTVISPEISKDLEFLEQDGKIKVIKNGYTREILTNFKIVFCATDDPFVNKKVHDDCVKEGIIINVADVPDLCDFILPANVRRGNLTISISSQGKSPFFAKALKKKLSQVIPPVYEKISGLAGDYRKKIMDKNGTVSSSEKNRMFRRFTDIDWKKVIEEEGDTESLKLMNELLKEFE